jgi:aspartate ammonia-lyase
VLQEPTRPPGVRSQTEARGENAGPADGFSGSYTDRKVEAFPVSGVELRLYPHLIRACGMVKLAAARANFEYGRLSAEVLEGIESACQDLIQGGMRDEFRIDVLQGGAATAMNTIANAVIADRALERMGRGRGEYVYCHPQEHVGCAQAPSEVYSLALHVGLALGHGELAAEVKRLASALRAKGRELAPLPAGVRPAASDEPGPPELEALAKTLIEPARALRGAQRALGRIRLSAVHETGLDTNAGFLERWAHQLARITGFPIRMAGGRVMAGDRHGTRRVSTPSSARGDSDLDNEVFVLYSSSLKNLAVRLSRISTDLRRVFAPPRAACEADHPRSAASPRWAGMDPIVPEIVNMVGFRAIGSDLTVTLAAEAGPLEQNMFEPVIAACLFDAQTTCSCAAWALRVRCVEGITVAAAEAPDGSPPGGDVAAEVMKAGRSIALLLEENQELSQRPMASVRPPRGTAAWRRPSRRNARE